MKVTTHSCVLYEREGVNGLLIVPGDKQNNEAEPSMDGKLTVIGVELTAGKLSKSLIGLVGH